MRTICTKDLKKRLEKELYYIFGLGKASNRFMDVVKKYNYEKNFLGYIVSRKETDDVFELQNISEKNALVLIATHAVNADEIEKILEDERFTNYYWVYPNIFEMEIDADPIQTECVVETRKLINKLGDRNKIQLACYLHFIEGVITGNEEEKSYYFKVHSLFTKEETVKKKAKQFEKTILDIKTNGMAELKPIIMSQSGIVMDGLHRTALSYYFGEETILANIYMDSNCVDCLNVIDSFSMESLQDVDIGIIDMIARMNWGSDR